MFDSCQRARAHFTPIAPLLFLVLLSSLTSAFRVYLPIASGSNMSVSYVVDIEHAVADGGAPHAARSAGAKSCAHLFAPGDIVRGMETMCRRLMGPEIEFEIACGATPVMVMADSGQFEQVVMAS